MQRSLLLPAAALAASLLLAACGGSADATDAGAPADGDGAPPVAGMCAPDMPDCVDTVVDAEEPDPADADAVREAARALIGTAEADLAPEVRVGRRGAEHLMLTEDYRIGRITVELDPDDAGVFRVTKVVLELEGGPETFSS